MKILIYGMQFKPDLIGIGKYTGEMTDWLFKQGHEIRVITAPHYYPEWKQNKSIWWFQHERNPYSIWRCPIYVPAQPRGLTRILHLISFALTSLPILIRNLVWRPNIVIAIEPPFVTTPLTIIYSKLTKAKSILHIQDLEIDAAFSLNIIKNEFVFNILIKIEKFLLDRFDNITTISPMMKKQLIKKGIAERKISILPNWADTLNINPDVDNKYLRDRHAIDSKKKIILYSGNIGKKQNLRNVILVAENIQNNENNCLFLIVGDGAYKNQMVEEVTNRKLTNFMFLPLQSNKDYAALLTLADLHLITQDKNISEFVMPSKLTNILSAGGVSIISAKSSTEFASLVKKHNLGYLIEPDSKTELFDAINYLLTDISSRRNIALKARYYAEKYLSKNSILSEFEKNLLN